MSMEDIGRLTLDQIDLIADEGCPGEKPGKLSFEQVQAMWEANQPKAEPHTEEISTDAYAIGDRVFMLENTWYSVISPES